MSYELTTTKKSLFSEMDTLFTHLCENHESLKKALELYTGLEVISIDVDNDEVVFNDDESALDDRRFVGFYLSVDDGSFHEPGRPTEIVQHMEENNEYPDGVVPWQPFEYKEPDQLLEYINTV